MIYYKQCWLVNKNHEGEKCIHVAWIPEQYAKYGKIIKIKDEDGWEVIAVGALRVPEQEALENSLDYKRTRKASDI